MLQHPVAGKTCRSGPKNGPGVHGSISLGRYFQRTVLKCKSIFFQLSSAVAICLFRSKLQITTFAVQSFCTQKNLTMPVNKNALIRYQTLDRCFRNSGRNYLFEDLQAEIDKVLQELSPNAGGISRRQLFMDIQFMESEAGWSVPLERVAMGKKTAYRYEDPHFSINNQPLNETEVKQIDSALQILSRFRGLPQFEWISEIVPLMENKLGIAGGGREVISFDSNVDYKGFENITPIFNAITNRRVLRITYQDFKTTEPAILNFHPYYLKQYNNRWFAFGFNEANAFPAWNLSLDRIQHIEETQSHYKDTDTDWDDYFYDIIGVTRLQNKEPEEIKLLFNKNIAPYITTKPLHPSQKERLTDDGLETRIKVIPNFELESLILSFAENVIILGPDWLKEKMKERFQAALGKYS